MPLSVPATIECASLNDLINQLLKESNNADYLKPKEFDFLVNGELLRAPLGDHARERGISTESTIEIEYIDRTPAPEPQTSLLHDDWVSGVHTSNQWYVCLNTF